VVDDHYLGEGNVGVVVLLADLTGTGAGRA
jgi:hypothetical protein